ncbi:MAG: ABC transporter substrate-binding protein [Myxococcaceae bacterium]
MTPKSRHAAALTVALLALTLASCDRCGGSTTVDAGPVDAGPPVLTEKEPNDNAGQALVIEKTSFVDANLGADPQKPDQDWYQLKASLPKTVDFTATCPNGADIALEVVDEAGGVLQKVNQGGVGVSERMPNLDVSARAFIRVVALKKGVGGAYQVTAKFGERMPGYELEPNERKVDATAVALGQAISGSISFDSDVDFFRYELPSDAPPVPEGLDAVDAGDDAGVDAGSDAGTDAGVVPEKRLSLRIDVSAVEGVALDVQVLTEAEAVLFAAKSGENAPLSLRNVGVRAADRLIYVAVRSKKGSHAEVSYTLTVAPEDNGGSAEFEPNDELSRATDLPANSYRDGFISPRGDVDYFRLMTDGPSIAKLQLSGVDKVDLVLSVVQSVDGKPEETVLKVNEGGSREPEQLNNVSCNGVCFIKVEGAPKKVDGKWVKEDENGDQSYRLNAIVVPDDGTEEREPNNTQATATPVSFGKQMRGTVYPKKDVDYFALDLRDRPVKTAVNATLLGVLKVDVGLYLHRVEADGKLTLVQTSDSAKGDKAETIRFAAEPGLYVFEVRDTKNREANFQDSYQLNVDEGGE